jgi:hypothetical protein
MKVCIVTLIRTPNSGSYLQGRALGRAIEKLGHEVCYFNTKRSFKNRLHDSVKTVRMLFKDGPSEFKKQVGSLKSFARLQNELEFTDDASEADCVVLGSDTIWNLDAPSLKKKTDLFWGLVFPGRIITYAASAANAGEDHFISDPVCKKAAARWFAIGVRDKHTRDVISLLTDKPIEINCDPTLLFDREHYLDEAGKLPEGRFIFLYSFDDFSAKQSEELRRFAKEKGLEIVQGVNGRKQSSADRSVENSPENFIRNLLAAEYVVTDTFHGCIFSVNFNKRFAVIDRGKNKVSDALNAFGMSERLVSKGGSIVEALEASSDGSECIEKLDALRASSWEYLEKNLS